MAREHRARLTRTGRGVCRSLLSGIPPALWEARNRSQPLLGYLSECVDRAKTCLPLQDLRSRRMEQRNASRIQESAHLAHR